MRRYLSCIFLLGVLVIGGIAAAGENEVTVVASGVGATENEANRQAYRNAVEQVIGALIMSQTHVDNYQLISDKIVSFSDGYVKSVKALKPTQPIGNGFVEVALAVTVAKGKLRDKLKEEKISITAVDGESMFAEVVTQKERSQNRATAAAKILDELPASVLRVTADMPSVSSKNNAVVVPVTVEVDLDAYAKYCRSFTEHMRQFNFHESNRTVDFDPAQRLNMPPSAIFGEGKKSDVIAVALCEQVNVDAKKSRWKVWDVDEAAFNAFAEASSWNSVRVEILDSTGYTLAAQTFGLYHNHTNKNRDKPGRAQDGRYYPIVVCNTPKTSDGVFKRWMVIIAPRLDVDGHYIAAQGRVTVGSTDGYSKKTDLEFILSEDELKNARNIKCSIFKDPK